METDNVGNETREMDRRDFLRKGISTAASIIAYSALSNLANGQERSRAAGITSASRNKYCIKNYTPIQWILNQNNEQTIIGNNNPNVFSDRLENLCFTDKAPLERELTEWEITTLAKLVPIKREIEQHSAYYAIHPMWATMFFTFESSLKPADHNQLSDDFGLGQVKLKSEKLAKSLGTAPNNKFYSSFLDRRKSVFEPETNIIISMLLHRYNIESNHLKDSNQAYAVYVRGKAGLSWFKNPNKLTKEKVAALQERYNYYQNILPLFRLEENELSGIKSEDTRTLLKLYHSNLEPKETYKRELDYFLNDLERTAKGDARSVLVYDDCATFFKTLDFCYGETPRDSRRRILEIGRELSELVTDKELKDRVDKATQTLKVIG